MPESRDELFKQWIKFNKAKKTAKSNLNKIEEKLEAIYGTIFEGNSKTFKEEDLGFSINLKKNIKHNLDQETWKTTRITIPENLRPEKLSYSLDIKGFEYLKKEEPEIYKKVSNCVEIKNNKTTIKVEKI